MTERRLWHTARAALQPYAHLVRVESPVAPGIPDLAYCIHGGYAGWLELKYLARWPVRPSTPVVIPTLTPAQVVFAEQWAAKGGRAALLLQVGRWYGLLPPAAMRACYRRTLTSGQMAGFGLGERPWVELVRRLKQ